MLTWPEYTALRDQYKGHSVGSKFRKLIGRHDPNAGTLEQLNDAVSAYITSGGMFMHLGAVHDAIDAIARTPKVEKYGSFLAELLLLIPPRPTGPIPGRMAEAITRMGGPAVVPQPAAHELMSAMIEAQQESAFRMFVEGSYISGRDRSLTPPEVTWKKGALKSMGDMLKAWSETATTIVGEVSQANPDERLAVLRRRLETPAEVQAAGRTAVEGGKVSLPTPASDRRAALGRRAPGAVADVIGGTPDVYELGRAGASGFGPGQGFAFADLDNGELGSRLGLLKNDPASLLDGPTADYFMSAIGVAMSCLGVATGLISEIKAAFAVHSAWKLKAAYGVVPFGNATAAVQGVRELLHRYSAELASMGAADIGGGATSLAGLGPIGGVVAMGVKILIRVALALRDAEEVIKARKYLEEGALWKDKSFVIKAMSDVPLFAAYFVMSASTSDLVGLLSNPHAFSIQTFKSDVEQVKPQIEYLRNMANKCQMHATWGLSPMTGWMQCLDSRWYMQPTKEAYNLFQEFKRGDTGAMVGRVKNLKKRFEAAQGGKG